MDGTLTDTSTPGPSGSGSNGNEGVLHSPKSPELETYHKMQFRVIPRTPLLEGDLIGLQEIHSTYSKPCQQDSKRARELDLLYICLLTDEWSWRRKGNITIGTPKIWSPKIYIYILIKKINNQKKNQHRRRDIYVWSKEEENIYNIWWLGVQTRNIILYHELKTVTAFLKMFWKCQIWIEY